MALTKEQIRIMDGITGLNSVQTSAKPSNNNSLSDEDIKRMDEITGLAQYEAPKNENPLRQQIIDDDPIKAKEWEDKGPITPYEAALDASREFNGTYDKVIQRPKAHGSVGLNPLGKAVSEFLDDKLPAIKKAIKSMNEAAKPLAESEIKFQEKQAELNKARQGVNENDKTKRYDITGYDRTGRPIYSETDLLDKIGFIEALGENFAKGTAFGSIAEGVNDAALRKIKDKIVKGETIYQDELDALNRHYDREREKIVRGYTPAAQMGSGLGYSLGLLSDFIWGGAVVKAIGAGAIGGNIALKSYLGLRNANVGVKAAGAISKTAGIAAEGVALPLIHTVVNPYRTYEAYQGRMLNNEIELTDRGNLIFKESDEKPATAFFKSLGKVYDMYLAEIIGGNILGAATNSIGKGIGYAATPVIENLFKRFPALEPFMKKSLVAFSKKFEELNKMPVLGKSTDWIKNTARFDGFLEECGEEALEDVLNLTLGVDNEDRTLENYAKAIFKTPEEWAVIAGTIAIQGAGLSAANYMIAKSMAEKGKSPEEIQETISNISESQSHEIVDELIKNNDIAINELNTPEEEAAEKRQKAVERISRGFQQGNIKDKRMADAAANLVVTMAEKIDRTSPIPLEKIVEDYRPTIKAVDEVGYAQGEIAAQDEGQRRIDERLAALEREFEQFADENLDTENADERLQKFEELENEYNELMELRNQGQEYYQAANTAGAEEGEKLKAAKEWKEKGTDSKYFKKWFGDSKVVDENGKPLVVYHGTNANFEKFEIGDIGYHFGNIEQASERMTDFVDGNPHIMPVYLKMSNPLDIVSDVGDWLDVDTVKEYLHEYEVLSDEEFKNTNTLSEITSLLQNKGYDGVIYENQFEGKGKSYIVFNSSQIKSVDNQGTFDAENPNIYYQRKQYDNPNQMKFNFDEIVEKQVEQQKLIFQPESKTEQSVQENIKQNYKKADIVQEKNDKANNDEIVDTGDSLLGNLKKNKKQYTWDELDNMNDLLRKKYLSKSYIYQLPSADELRKENLSDRTIAFIYFIHSKINARPAKGFDEKKEYQKIYFDGVQEIMQKTIDFAKKNNELITNYSRNSARNKELFDAIFPDYDNKKPYNVFTAYPDLNRKALIVGGNKLVGALQLGYYTESDINKALSLVNKEKDNKSSTKSDLEGWEKKFSVAESYRGWVIADRKSGMIISNRDLPSKEIAEQIAKQMYEYIQKKNSSFTVDFKNLRNYIPRRENNQNVKPEALIEVFGFRGINFGNWTKQSERQDFLNLAYDSLYDLAELLNLPPKALSLDGKLGLAFGAQGRSNAAGHFIPEYNEINLTRKGGAGSLAHEWWHALDYYFGDLSLDKEFSGKSALGSDSQGKLRTEIFDALKNLDERIKYTPLTEKELTEKADAIEKGARRNIEYYANEIKRSFAKSKNADKIAALIDDIVKNAATIDTKNDKELQEKYYNLLDERRRTWENLGKLSNLEYQCRKLQQVKELAAASKKYSKFYENAKLLNTYEKGMGSGYWTRNTELGARAFASYILDKTVKQDYTNNFLVRDEKGEISFNLEVIAKKLQAKQKGEEYTGEEKSIIEWYPAEPEERKRIFDAFDNLFNTIQYKQTDRGYKLYQINSNNNNKIVDWTNKFNKKETTDLSKVREYINKVIENGNKFATANPDWFIDIKKENSNRKQKRITNKIANEQNFQKLDKEGKIRHNKYVLELEELIKNAEYAPPPKQVKGSKRNRKSFIEKYHYFKVNIRVDNNIYEIILDTEQYKGESENKPQTVHLYNIQEKTSGTYANNAYLKKPDANNIIPQSEQNLTPIINKNKVFNQDDNLEESLFYDNDISDKLQKIKGSYIPTERIIELFKDADESTIVHELAHWYLDLINEYAQYSEELTQDLEKVRAFLKNDGGEFTREQHEKFARAFEAYIRTGYARNNRLKKIFEDFKNWLISIYDDIKKIVYTENGVDKYFTDDEVKTIQNLFDRLLTSEKERIKTTVFDKVQEVEDKINAIKENEKKELDELDKIYKDNIAALNRQSDKKRSVQEYLDLADKMTSRETKEVKNFKERFKKATLDILEIATGYDRKFIANSRNWEKVEYALENAEDKITISGFAPEWGEFYSPDGVTYDNDEIGGDYKLASQAFEVLTNGEYNKTFDENYEFEDINKFSAKVDYLAAKVKTLKGDERSAAIEAMFSLFDEMPSLPDEVAQDLLKKVREVAQKAEEDSREDYNSRVLNSIPIIQQLQYIVTKKLNDLKVYNPEMRYKMRLSKSHRLYRYIKDIKSINSAKKQIRRINEFIIDDMRNNQRSLLHNEIQKQIKVNSKLVKSGTISKGKFDWRTNTVFAELVELNKLKREEAEAQLGAILQIQDAAKGENRDSFDENETAEFNKTNNFQQNLKNKFIQYRSMKVQDLDVEHTILLLQDILELKEKGRQAKSEQDFINKTQKWNTRNNLLDILEVTKQSGAKFGANWVAGVGKGVSLNGGTLANWESLLNSIFNKDTAQKYSLLLDEANSDIYARKHILNFYQRAFDIYGFRKPSSWDRFLDYDDMQPIIKLFQDYDNEKYTYIQKVFSINSPDGFARSSIEISKSQMITMFAWSLNEKLEQRLFNQFGVEQIRDMFEQRLSDEDKELAWALIDTCEDMRDDINEVFINTTGLSLPKVENYFPSKAERVQSDLDLYHDNWVKSSNPSFIKERKICNRIPMKPLSPLEILIPHINKTAKYVVMSEHVNFLNQVFKDTAIKTKMQEIWGSEDGAKIYQTLINKLAACTFTNYSKGTNLVAGALDTLSRNYITSAIGFSPKVALGQLLSVVNYAENMPAGVWAKGFVKTLVHPVENFKYMLDNCEYLQTRLAGNSQNEVIAILTSEKDRFRTLRNFMTSNVKWGDIIAITLGGKPYVDYLMQQGMSKEEAFDKFVENTLRAQQAGTTSSISEWQSAQAKNCLTRMFFAFRNTDMQYERKFIDTLIQGKKGEIGKKELIKKVFIYKILNPFMFTSFLQNMALIAFFRGIFAGDDPDEVIFGGLRNALEAIMLGGLNAYGFAGFIASSVVESIIAAFDKEFKHFEKVVPVMSDFDHQVQKYLKGDLDFADYVDAVALGSEYALGIPTTKVVNTVEGMGDIAQGNIGVGLSRMAGWGRYTATKAWTGKAPKKR